MNTTPREISKLLSLSDSALYTVGDVMSANISSVFVTTEGACRRQFIDVPARPPLCISLTSYFDDVILRQAMSVLLSSFVSM